MCGACVPRSSASRPWRSRPSSRRSAGWRARQRADQVVVATLRLLLGSLVLGSIHVCPWLARELGDRTHDAIGEFAGLQLLQDRIGRRGRGLQRRPDAYLDPARRGITAPIGWTLSVPTMATGTTGTPVSMATRATPSCRGRAGRRGYGSPRDRPRATCRRGLPGRRWPGPQQQHRRWSGPAGSARCRVRKPPQPSLDSRPVKYSFFARKVTRRRVITGRNSESHIDRWLLASSAPPEEGMLRAPNDGPEEHPKKRAKRVLHEPVEHPDLRPSRGAYGVRPARAGFVRRGWS